MEQAYEDVRLEPLLTIDQVGEALNVSRATVYRIIDGGELSPIRVAQRAARFVPSDVRDYIDRRREGARAS